MNTSGKTNGNVRTNGNARTNGNVRINANRRVNTTVRTNTGGGNNMLIGILVFALIGGAIYFFWSKRFNPETFSGTHLAVRVISNLSELIEALKSQTPMSYIIDCSNNIIWKKGDAIPSSPSKGTYTIIFKTNGQLFPSSMIINKGELPITWKNIAENHIAPNIYSKSIVLSNVAQDISSFESLSDEDYVKKIMSLATDEYPVKVC
jgi:LPXTG-motif cell wall-anchored protein